MTDVTSKEAVTLAYLARHKDLEVKERKRILSTLNGPAHEVASKLFEDVPNESSALETKKAVVRSLTPTTKNRAAKSSSRRALANR